MPKPEKPKREQPELRRRTQPERPEPKVPKKYDFHSPKVMELVTRLRMVQLKFVQMSEQLAELLNKLDDHFDSVFMNYVTEDQSLGIRIALVKGRFKSVIRLIYSLRVGRWYLLVTEDGATRRSDLGVDPPFGVILRELRDLKPVERIMLEASVVKELRAMGQEDMADAVEKICAPSVDRQALVAQIDEIEVLAGEVGGVLLENDLSVEQSEQIRHRLDTIERRLQEIGRL